MNVRQKHGQQTADFAVNKCMKYGHIVSCLLPDKYFLICAREQ